MQFKRLAYTSLAALDLDERQLRDIHESARVLNGIDGISGLLIFNGTRFLQWIEGPPGAIDDLVARLRRDSRHSALEIRDEHHADERLFGGWAMELVNVRGSFLQAREDIAAALPERLPEPIRARILSLADQVDLDVKL